MELEHLLSVFIGDVPDPETALDYAKQIHEFFKNPLDSAKLDQYIGLAFPADEDGLFKFLRNKLTNKKYNKSKEEVLNVILLILNRKDEIWTNYVVPFCLRFKVITNMYWKNGSEPAKHQQLALDSLVALLENYGDTLDESEFELGVLYWELLPASEKSGYQPSVRGKMFYLLGLVACRMKGTLLSREEVFSQLFRHIVTAVKGQVESKDSHLEVAILHGALKAMNRILCSFGSKIDVESAEWKGFYVNLEQVVDPRCSIANDGNGQFQVKRREFQRAGLELVANNANFFGKQLYRDYEQWYKDLIIWSKSTNADDSSVGRKAMYKFMESVADYTKIEAEEMQTDAHENFVAYFLKTFLEIMDTTNVTRSELLIAIKGMGLLTSSCSNNPEKIDQVFNKIMMLINDIVVELNSPVTDKYSGSLSLVSAYLESIGSILPYIQTSKNDLNADLKFLSHLNTIEQLSIQLMTFYPDLSERIRGFSHISVFKIADSLRLKHNHLYLPFLDRVLNLALSHIISSPTKAELDILLESWNKTTNANDSKKSATSQLGLRGVKSYTQFWINLTSFGSGPTVVSLYDCMIQWVLSTLAKLDLTLLLDNEDQNEIGPVGDITATMTATVVKDFHLFVNLVELFQIVILKSNLQYFEKWIDVFIVEMLCMIEQHPLVSGFYKILTVTLNVARELQYFKQNNKDRKVILQKCNEFMRIVTNKTNEFRDDLLMSVLELWLATPDEIIIQNFRSLTATLKIIFGMGRTCFTIAEHCIEAVHRWILMEEFPREEIEKLIQSLLPIWQTYFVTTGAESVYEGRTNKIVPVRKKSPNQRVSKLKFIQEELNEATLKTVQLKLLHLIGSFGHLLDSEKDLANKIGLSTEDRFLKYAVPFQDIRPDVYLDTLLPRLLSLCENSTERQIRTSACELLHTFALYFLGYACKSTGANDNMQLFEKMFSTILKLGCDGDVLVRQLFNPLSIQSVHWFTKPNNVHGELISQIIVDGLVQSENAPLRDFAAACLSEFFTWALKHDNEKSADSVLSIIEALSTHAVPQYRLGAVVGFNSIYKDFRENKKLCSKVTISLLTSFVRCLALSSGLEDDSLLLKTTTVAISHLQKIVIKYKEAFNVALSGRKKCAVIPSDCPCLKDVVEWLLVQAGRAETICRQECIKTLKLLAPFVRGISSVADFLELFSTNNGCERFVGIAEASRESCLMNQDDGLILFLDASSEFYSLLDDCGLLRPIILSHESSVFLSSFKKLLQIPVVDSITEKFFKTALNVLCRFEHFKAFVDEPVYEQFLSFSIQVSQAYFDYDRTMQLVNIWKKSSLNIDRNSNIYDVQLNVEVLFEHKSNTELLKRFQWLTIVAENQFLEKLCSSEEVKTFVISGFWNIIEKNFYRSDNSSSLQTISISKSRRTVLEWFLRLYLSLEIDKTKVPDAICDLTSVDVKTSFLQKTTKGDVFQQNLLAALLHCEEIMDFPTLLNKCKVEKIGVIVEGFLSTLKQNRKLRIEIGQKIFDKVIRSWMLLSVNCDRHTVARILSGLASIDIQACRDSKVLSDWWCGRELMNARHLDLKHKSEFIGFLGLFALSKKPEVILQVMYAEYSLYLYAAVHIELKAYLIDAVKQMCIADVNTNMIWSEEEGYITKIMLQILVVFEKLPQQWKLLEVLILFVSKSTTIAGNDSNPPVFKEIKKRLVKVVNSYVDKKETLQAKISGYMYNTVMENDECRRNLSACRICLIPVIAAITPQAAGIFYREYLFNIIDKANCIETSIEAIHSKTVAFNLMEMLAHQTGSKITKDLGMIHLFQQKLRNQGIPNEEVEKQNVLRAVTTACIKFKKNGMSPQSDQLLQLALLQCNMASYNAVAANLIATSSNANILEGILINENRLKNNFLWENIIDCKMEYNFPLFLEETKDDKSITFSKTINETPNVEFAANSRQHIQMNNRINLLESSLASEATNYDFTASVTMGNFDYYQRIFNVEKNQNRKMPTSNIPDVCIESNEINKHDCMTAFVATIKRLVEVSLSPEPVTCPAWVKYLEKVLKSSQHINVKIFIIGALLDCQHILSTHASVFIDPILSLILDPKANNFGPEKLNYFIKDIILMLLTWRTTAVPTEDLKRKLLLYMLENLQHQEVVSTRQDVFNHNLAIIEKIVEYWVTNSDVIPSDKIMDMLRNPNPKIGLAICKSFLRAKKLPMADVSKLMNEFCRALKNNSKPIYCQAAENMGLLLKHLKDAEFSGLNDAFDFVKTKVIGEKNRSLPFLFILSYLQNHAPGMLVHFKLTIFEFLSNSTLRTDAIRLLPTCLNHEIKISESSEVKIVAENFYSELEGRKLFLGSCNTLVEAEAGLEILEGLINYLDDTKKLMKILEWMKLLEGDVEASLRSRYARCVFKVFIMLETPEAISYTEIQKSLQRVFVRLFRDQDPDVKKVVDDFWCHSVRKWKETPMLILELMEIVGDQENAVEIIIGLIIKRCSTAPDFDKDIFDKPLEDCTFFNYELDTSWRTKHATFQPLFAESLSSSQNFSTLPLAMQNSIMSQRRSVGKFGVNLLRATLSLANQRFTPTQQESEISQPMEIEDGTFQFLSQGHADLSSAEEISPSSSQNDPLAGLRKRFYHPRDTESIVRNVVDRQKGRMEAHIEAVRMKRNNVKLTRSYRVGELPDILIKHSDLLKTISSISKLDDNVGRSFIVILFTSMLESSERPKTDQNKSKSCQYKRRAQEVFESLLKNYGRLLKPNFVAALLEISILNNIPIRPSLVSDACNNLNLYELGILELETLVSNRLEPSQVSSKRAKLESNEPEDVSVWLRIAEFYKDLEEYDVLRNIFAISSLKMGTRGTVYNKARDALALEAEGKVEKALEIYSDLYIDSKANTNQYNFAISKYLEESVLNCLASLASWEQLFEETEHIKDNVCNDQMLEDVEFVGRILPFAVQSGLQMLFDESENAYSTKYKSFMLESEEDLIQFLSSQYPIEMAILQLSEDFQNTARSATLLEKGWNRGCEEFQLFSGLSLPQRRQKTLMLQQASVLQDILTWCKGLNSHNLEQKTKTLSLKSERACNFGKAALLNCDMVVAERSYFVCKIMEHEAFETKAEKEIVKKLKDLDLNQHLWALAIGLREKNLTIANKYLSKCQELGEAMSEADQLKWKKMYVSYLATFHENIPINEWLKMWASIWNKIEKHTDTGQLASTDAFQMQGELLRSLIEASLGKEHTVNNKYKRRINQLVAKQDGSQDSQESFGIVETALRGSTDLIDRLSKHNFETSSTADQASQMFNLLQLLQKSFPEKYGEDEKLTQLKLIYLLRSMESDQGERRLLFPTILSLIEKFPFLQSDFAKGAINIPTWIFLPWLDQIITLYRSRESSLRTVLSPILIRLKEMYPHAFQLQYSDMDVLQTSTDLQNMYSKSLKALVLPTILYRSFMDDLKICSKVTNLVGLKTILIEFKEKLLANENWNIFGKIHREYSTEMLTAITNVLETFMANETSGSRTDSTTDLNQLLNNISIYHNRKAKELTGLRGSKVLNLKDLSPWLAKFHHAICREEIEIPGLYDGLGKPDVSFNPKVVSFFPTVSVFSSLTNPIRYTMLGNDGKKVFFLAKQGDDLRQDRRIQQLLRISNKIFSDDCKSQKKNLHIVTYSVVPITEEFGIVQMVNKTVSLGNFICNSESLKSLKNQSMIAHSNWIRQTSDNPNFAESVRYLSSAKNVTRVDAAKQFDALISSIPRNLLNDHLKERSQSLETFFEIRQEMIRSYAVMSIVHWLLGIGDRHLENCLLSLETGYLVGIDFGRAFGTGNTVLQIPEMIPFRLSPQIQSLMSPYGCKGLLKETMLYGWRCLINSSELLLSIIKIFVEERNMNWLKDRKGRCSLLVPAEKWIPMDVMTKKLECKNPIVILLEELERHPQKKLVPVYSGVVKNGRECSLGRVELNAEEVIDSLIDLSTDKNILCRIYHGMCLWI